MIPPIDNRYFTYVSVSVSVCIYKKIDSQSSLVEIDKYIFYIFWSITLMPENIGSMIFFWEKNAWFLLKSLKNLRFKKLQFLEESHSFTIHRS